MKSFLILSALAFVLFAGCSSDEKAAEPAVVEAEQSQPQNATTEETPVALEQTLTDDERPQAVEESGGEPDPAETKDKPIVLAQAQTPVPGQAWEYKAGKDYHRLVPTQPTLGGADKIEVAEFFWYGCGLGWHTQ